MSYKTEKTRGFCDHRVRPEVAGGRGRTLGAGWRECSPSRIWDGGHIYTRGKAGQSVWRMSACRGNRGMTQA